MIDVDTAWSKIRENAIKALKTGMVWRSLVEGHGYEINQVLDDRIIITRHKGELQELTEARIIRAATEFNELGGVVQRRHLISPTVAEETAFVLFHPDLTWDDDNINIIEIDN